MAKKGRLRWGLLSTARINRALIGPLRSSRNSTLLAVASRSLERATSYAHEWGIPRFYSDYDSLLADPEIDVIYNSLPNALHAQWSIKAMQMGKHVLCEKPITTCVSELDSVIAVANKTNRVITEAIMYRHHPQTLLVKQIIDEGIIGKLQLVRGSFTYTNTRHLDPRLEPDLGGGSLWDIGCYPISFANYVIDSAPTEVSGHQIQGPTGVDLFFSGQIQFQNDITVQFDCSFISPFRTFMEFTGEKGRIYISTPFKPGEKEKILLYTDNQERSIPIKGIALYSGEVEDIENAILSGKPPRINITESRGNIVIIEKLLESATISNPGYLKINYSNSIGGLK